MYYTNPTYFVDHEPKVRVRHSRIRKPESRADIDPFQLDPSKKLDVWFRFLNERTNQGYTPEQIAEMWEVESKKYFQ